MMEDRGILEQLRDAKHPIAAPVGALFGAFVPLATSTVAHDELVQRAVAQATLAQHFQRATGFDPGWAIVAGGLLYSAITVWQWAYLAFYCRWKATGFVVLLEGVMVFSGTAWLRQTALVYLMGINALATASKVAKGVRARASDSLTAEADADVPSLSAPPSRNLLPPDPRTLPAFAFNEASDSQVASPDGRNTGRRHSTDDDAYERAQQLVSSTGDCSVSAVQRGLNVGHARASRIVARLVEQGVVGAPRRDGRRPVLAKAAGSHSIPIPLHAPSPTPLNGTSTV